MGSCASSFPPLPHEKKGSGSSSSSSRVIPCSDQVRVLQFSSEGGLDVMMTHHWNSNVKAIQVLLCYPRHFICPYHTPFHPHTTPALLPDEELYTGHVYALLPFTAITSTSPPPPPTTSTLQLEPPIATSTPQQPNEIAMINDVCTRENDKDVISVDRVRLHSDAGPTRRHAKRRRSSMMARHGRISWQPVLPTVDEGVF